MSNPTSQVAGRTAAGNITPLQCSADGSLRTAGRQFPVPSFNAVAYTYHGTTNNVATETFSAAGTNVARITTAYVDGVPASDNARKLTETFDLL